MQIKVRNRTIGQLEQQFQPLLRPVGSAKIDAVVHCQRNLIGYERAETNLILRVSVPADAGDHQAAEAPMCRRQRESADRIYTGLSHPGDRSGEPGLRVETAQNNGLLMPEYPRSQGLFAVCFRWT